MKKYSATQGATLLVLLLAVLIFSGCAVKQQSLQNEDKAKLKVAATIFPLADIVRNVGGSTVEVTTLVAPGASPHTFEARPSDIINLQSAALLFAIGHGVDDWTQELANGVENIKIITVDNEISLRQSLDSYVPNIFLEAEEEEEEGGQDPHYWLSVKNAKIIAQTVADALIAENPDDKSQYENNLKQYLTQLDDLDIELSNMLASYAGREVITFHDAWGYFTADYQLNIIGVFEHSPGKGPTPQYLKALNDTAIAHNIAVVFTEPQLSSDVIKPFMRDLGLKLFTLDPLGGDGEQDSYINLMRYNARTINNAFAE